jgi:hypothetical protein
MSEEKKNKFKGSGHKWLTEGLFLESSQPNENALYSLQPWDKRSNGKFYQSIHKLYVEMEDIAEWNFANTYFDGYQHWLVIKGRPFFKEYYAKMVEELNAKLSGKSLQTMLDQVAEGSASQATLKYLADKDYLKKAPVGKPKRTKQSKTQGDVVSFDLERMKR